jgi:hypothetical protein
MLSTQSRKSLLSSDRSFHPNKLSLTLVGLASITLTLGLIDPARAVNLSFRGNFDRDDDIRLLDFTVTSASQVTIKSLSYAGGTQADGTLVAAGGFDPILSLFDGAGNLIETNDDGGSRNVAADPRTNQRFDAFIKSVLNPGNYTVAVSQFYNFPSGTNLSRGFRHQGSENFTSVYNCSAGRFCDTSSDSRNNSYAVDIFRIDEPIPPESVPEPSTILGAFLAFGSIGGSKFLKNRKKSQKARSN